MNMTTAVDAVLALELLAGLPPRRLEHSSETMTHELETVYGVKLRRGAPSDRGARPFKKPEAPVIFLFKVPEGCTGIIDCDGRARPSIDGRIAVDARTAAALRLAGWETA
jgi:hypothetical protein